MHACTGTPSSTKNVITTTKHEIGITLSDSTKNKTDSLQVRYEGDTVMVYPDHQTDGSEDDSTQVQDSTIYYPNDSSPTHHSLVPQTIKPLTPSSTFRNLAINTEKLPPSDIHYDTLAWRIQRGVTSSVSMKSYHEGIINLLTETADLKNANWKVYVSFMMPHEKKEIKQLLQKCGLSTWWFSVLSDKTLENIIDSIKSHITAGNIFFIDEKEIENLKNRFIALK